MKRFPLIFICFFSLLASGQTWSETSKLYALDQQSDDNYGCDVAIDEQYAIVGAWHHDLDGSGSNSLSNAGAAYILAFDSTSQTWSEQAKLLAADRELNDAFGISVDINGSYAVVGAVEHNAAKGAAYVFEKNSSDIWVQVAKLENPIPQSSDRFGNAVAISGNYIVVGAYQEDEDENDMNTMMNAGSVYIYKRTSGTWSFYQKIVASNRDIQDYFGFDVAIDDDFLIVGAYRADPDTAFVETGAAYVFELQAGTWVEIKKLTPFAPNHNDRFGYSVALDDDLFVVGAPYHGYDMFASVFKLNSGAAYIFDGASSFGEHKITHSDRFDQDNLGQSVAIANETVVVGSHNQDYDLSGAPPYFGNGGAAYIFKKAPGSGVYAEYQKLVAADRFGGDQFGYSVSISEDNILVGAIEDNQDTGTIKPSVGAVYIFDSGSSIGLNDFNKTSYSVYPNPFLNQFSIITSTNSTNAILHVFNPLGEEILQQKIKSRFTIDTKNWSAGIYSLVLIENGKTFVCKRIKLSQ